MKNILLLSFLLSISHFLYAQDCPSDDFNSGYGNWTGSGTYTNATAGNTGNGVGFNSTNDNIVTSSAVKNPTSVTYSLARSSSTANRTLDLDYATSSTGPWTNLASYTQDDLTTTHQEFTTDLSGLGAGDFYFRFNLSQRSGGSMYLDDVEFTCDDTACSITIDSATATCNGDDVDIVINFTVNNGGGPYEVDVNAEGYVEMESGDTYTITGPTTSLANATISILDVTTANCEGTGTVNIPACPQTSVQVRINEFHYDNVGADVNEFVEIFVPSLDGLSDPENYSIELIDNNGGDILNSVTLDNTTESDDEYGTYYVWEVSGIQNGGDGIALCGPDGLIQFWSYEAALTATEGCATDEPSTQTNVTESSSTPATHSLQFFPNPLDPVLQTNNIPGTWAAGEHTKGATNDSGLITPITLAFFTAQKVGKTGELNWKTLSEENNEVIEIEKSFDGLQWSKIGAVDGHGTTQIAQEYKFVDYDLIQGKNYYRLKQVDFDGAFTYSDIVFIDVELAENFKIAAASKNALTVNSSLSGRANYAIFNSTGNIVAQGEFDAVRGSQSIYYRSGELASGFYIIHLQVDQHSTKSKFIIQ